MILYDLIACITRIVFELLVVLAVFFCLLLLGASLAFADDGYYELMGTGTDPESGVTIVLFTSDANTLTACAYNMGLVLGSWYSDNLINVVTKPYTQIGQNVEVAFTSNTMSDGKIYEMQLTCTYQSLTS